MVAAGRMDRLITIEQNAETQSGTGDPAESWSTFATVWAGKRDLSGREFLEARQLASEATTEFTIHYRDDITTKMRIVLAGQVYDIEHAAEIGRGRGTRILAKARGV